MAAPEPLAPLARAAALVLLLLAAAPSLAARVPDGFAGVLRDAAAAQTASIAAAAQTGTAAASDPPATGPLPVVLWHGMGDSCCALGSIGGVAKFIESRLGVFAHSVATGEGELRDVASSFYGNVNDQVATVCRELTTSADLARELRGGFNMVGFSQGGQFLRAVVQRCGHELPGPVHALVTLGAQHAGVSNAPACAGAETGDGGGGGGNGAAAACAAMQAALALGAYSPWVRDHVVQAQYFKAPGSIDEYLERNVFLPDINNELRAGGGGVGGDGGDGDKTGGRSAGAEKRGNEGSSSGGSGGGSSRAALYKANLQSLERLVLYKFENDTVVEPSDSSFFGFWGEGDDERRVVPLRESRLYKDDLLGLRALDERGALVLDLVRDANHMQFTMRWFEENVMDKFLAAAPARGWLERARAHVRRPPSSA